MLISPLQKYEPKDFSGLVTDNHLGMMFATQPQLVSPLIEHIFQANGLNDIVSFMAQYPTLYLDSDSEYEWYLQGSDEKNFPLVFAGTSSTVAVTATDRLGIGGTRFYLGFDDSVYFGIRDVIVGEKTDSYRVRIIAEAGTTSGVNIFECELVTGDSNLFIPYEDLATGTRWSKDYSLVEQTLSQGGGKTHHTSPFRMRNVMSQIRKQYEVPGNMISKGANTPLAFSWKSQDGKIQTSWIKKLDYDFLTQFRRECARLLMYGQSNRKADGSYGNIGESGYEIRSGAGLEQQVAPSNYFYYNDFSIDWLVELALGLSVGKLPEDKREFVLSTGEYGMYQFHKAVSEKASLFVPNRTEDRISINGNKMTYKGQFVEYQAVNGISFKLVHDPLKDDSVRNKMMHPDGGTVKSREYTLLDFGTQNGQPNIQKVAVKGEEEIFRYIPGMRDPYSPYNNLTTPGMAASRVDGYEVHRMYIGGIKVHNPLRLARIIPSMLS